MTLLLALVCLTTAFALLGTALLSGRTATGVERSLEVLQDFSTAPDDLAAEADVPFADRVLAPLQARALSVGRRITGADQAEQIRRRLDFAGNPRDWSVDRVIGMKVMGAVAIPVAGLAYGLLVGVGLTWLVVIVLGGLVVGYFAPDIYLYNRTQQRSEAIRRTLADSVDLLTISVEAGLGFDAALQQVARKTDGPVAEEFARVIREMQLGLGRSESLKALAGRTNVDDFKAFVGAMVQADAFGVPIGQVLRVQSEEMRLKRRQHAEEKAHQVPVKIMVPLVLFILPCLFVVIMGPGALSAMEAFGSAQ
ncbi:type II secretion system F family protein [Nocardioides panacisoli]|uniref:type II secretion system F family protein n=1 Tax=Nocardioides panacisoli TaxID=627624 RepID=UPI001C627E07|nr:type II secretion system F family protein [Nocardioides panacisoli]QYJ04718.1 type II secretion system F family protein [Nocardioides panacisoli]